MLAVNGCDLLFSEPHLGAAITATNETHQEVTFVIEADGESLALPDVAMPGETTAVLAGGQVTEPSRFVEDRCTTGDLVAVAQDGSEVDRQAPPLCDGDEWVIDGE